ncbi:MAG TPA: CGNR zinc finger domain-containing protein [Pseudonocardiaceae bacterium]|nr:CGNR zinc finger domain-containing protein [Pseudonocardiaceae bacterium]
MICFAASNRLGRCARVGCTTAFVDTSRNGRRQYCTLRCPHRRSAASPQPLTRRLAGRERHDISSWRRLTHPDRGVYRRTITIGVFQFRG